MAAKNKSHKINEPAFIQNLQQNSGKTDVWLKSLLMQKRTGSEIFDFRSFLFEKDKCR